MKKSMIGAITLSLLLVMALGSNAFAQFRIENTMKGGANFSDLGGNDAGNTNMSLGFIGGFATTLHIANLFSIQPEFLYVRKGADQFTSSQERYIVVNANVVLDYIEVPVLAKFTFPMANNLVPGLYVGPSFAFKLRSKLNVVEARSEEGALLGSMQPKIVNAKSTDIGLVIGTALAVDGPATRIVVDFRYTFGFNNILKAHSFVASSSEIALIDDNDQPLDLKNRTLAIMVGMGF